MKKEMEFLKMGIEEMRSCLRNIRAWMDGGRGEE